ncbi:lysosomal proton-coupled steroid conjugate and bile acid symporter SLC46A3-like [Ylistrum balloti]|uniref:lysosomal proton-coupled steroid conjugate and bile acid symporter SLC46A3-like n=1 Tax=Ylistrum balloti TaxID=509963 RepID=UPI0029059D84|nr:lysosomal proton-coupled steroid conjugate and bile acid symporter SLC46A3-like [Ylistrum balloti]
MFYLFGLILSSLLTTQYTVYYLQTRMFPNSSLSSSDNMSACNVNTSTKEYHERTTVQKTATQIGIYRALIESLPALITSSIIGGLSDRYGRTRILIYTTILSFLSACLTNILIYLEINVYYLLFSSAVYSIGGGLYGTLSICFAYISDVTSPGKQRTLMIAFLEASIGFGGAVSGFVSGFIIESFGFFYASIFVSASAFSSVLVIVLFLPPLRPPDILISKTTTLENVRASFIFYFETSPKRYKYVLAIVSFMFGTFSILGKLNIEVLYQLNAPFCWSSLKVGYYSAISTSASMILGVACVKVLQKWFVDEVIAIFGGISGMAANTVEAFALSDQILFLVPVIGFLNRLVFPIIRAMLSKLTPPDRQGALFAGIAVVEILAGMASSLGTSVIYKETVETMRGLVFLVLAGSAFLNVFFLLIYRVKNGGSKTLPIQDVTKIITETQKLIGDEG